MGRTVPAVVRAFDLLDLLAANPDGLTLSSLSTLSGLPRSTTHELVSTLIDKGAISRVGESPRYFLGLHLFTLGSAYAKALDLIRESQLRAADLARHVNETVQVAILDGFDSVVIARGDSDRAVRMVSYVGSRTPAHCTGVGKAILAYMSKTELATRMEHANFVPMTAHSITSREQLSQELCDTRERGWAKDDCESNIDVYCIAVPIFDASNNVKAAISVSVPRPKMTQTKRSALLKELGRSAYEISRYLGYSGQPRLLFGAQGEAVAD